MNPTALASLAVFLAYFVGAIPFAYVFVRAAKGIDIRTVGSGNVGATNAARVLGLRGFLLVFGCDLLKGLIPTLALPFAVRRITGEPFSDLPILVALATILGHNFPIFLNFRGGKGVATSLGATFGLAPIASLAAVVAFGLALRISRYVSLSSLIGAAVFALGYFGMVIGYERKYPFDREHVALSGLTLGLVTMLVVRHRANWSRIRDGTEPKITRRRKDSGRASIVVLAVVVLAGLGAVAAERLARRGTADCGAFTLEELVRTRTGHQRATSPVFADDSLTLAVLCPRYDRLMIYRVDDEQVSLVKDVTLDGQPMGLASAGGRFLVLERPSGDARHLEPGWVQAYSLDGQKQGEPVVVGNYPTALATIAGGEAVLVLTAGHSEGDPHHGEPALEVADLTTARVVGRLTFDRPGDHPERVTASLSGAAASVALGGSNEVASIDLADLTNPRLIGRSALPVRAVPYPSRSGDDWIMMPVDSDRECALIPSTGDPMASHLASVRLDASEVELRAVGAPDPIGRLALRGAANLGAIKPTGVACSRDGRMLAITSRSGGVHLVAIRPAVGSTQISRRDGEVR